MNQVTKQINTITNKLPKNFHIKINFNTSHIISPTFINKYFNFHNNFTHHNLNLILKITKHKPLNINKNLIQQLNILHKNNFIITLNNFNTNYSKLSYLHNLHINYIKINHNFINHINTNPKSTQILNYILNLTHKLSINIITKNIKTKKQLNYLNQNNITFQQNYYFYKPITYINLIKIILSKPKIKIIIK